MNVRERRRFEKVFRGLSYLFISYKHCFFFLFFFLEELVSVSKRKDQSRMRLRNTMGVFPEWLHAARLLG